MTTIQLGIWLGVGKALPYFSQALQYCFLLRKHWPKAQARSSPSLAWPGPGPAQISEIWEPGNPESWDPTKSQKMEILKNQIHVTQNVGKVWISRKQNPPDPFPCHFMQFSPWTEKIPKFIIFGLFSLLGQCCYPPMVGILISASLGDVGVLEMAASMLTSLM